MTITSAAEQQPQTGAAAAVAPPPPAPADSATAAAAPKRSRREPAHRPVVAMPVGPVLVGTANVATIAGATLYAATGPAGLVAAAATVAGVGVAKAAHRGASNKRATGSVFGARRTGRSTTSLGGRRAGGVGGGRSAAGKGLLGGHRTGAAPTGRGRAASGTGRPGAGTGRAGTGKGLLGGGRGTAGKGLLGGGRSGSGNGRGGLLGGRGRAGTATGAGGGLRPSRAGRLRRASSRLARAAGPLGRGAVRLAKVAGKAAGPLGRGIGRAVVSPMHAWRAARQGLRAGSSPWAAARAARTRALKAGARRGRRHARWLRGWGAGLLALSAGGARSAWRAARRRYSGEQPTAEPEDTGRVAPEVRQPSGEEATPNNPTAEPAVVPAPVPAPVLVIGGHGPAPTQGDDPMSSRRLLALAQEMVEVARRHEPEGMLEVVADYHLMPEILANVALALKTAHEKAQERYPVHTTVCDTIASVHRAQLATTSTARDVGPAIERLHKVDLDRLRAPRKGAVAEAMWDVRANRERM